MSSSVEWQYRREGMPLKRKWCQKCVKKQVSLAVEKQVSLIPSARAGSQR